MTEEKRLLLRHLVGHRRHVLAQVEGLDDAQLRTPVLPSGWHVAGLLKHLALSDEHYWFRCVMGGESQDYFPAGPRGDWLLTGGETPAGMVTLYRDEIAAADALLDGLDLDTPPAAPDPVWAEWGMSYPDLRTVLLHVIGETATHAGQLDAVVELLDGRQYVVLD